MNRDKNEKLVLSYAGECLVPSLLVFRDILLRMVDASSSCHPTFYERYRSVGLLVSPMESQCAAVAVSVQLVFGGDLVDGMVWSPSWKKKCRHNWNRIDGDEFDLTSCQFGGDGITPLKRGKLIRGEEEVGSRFLEFAKAAKERWLLAKKEGVNILGSSNGENRCLNQK